MQMYPSDHLGYKEQQYYSVVEEDYSYNNGSHCMQMMKPDHSIPKHTYNQNHGHDHFIPKHTYNQNHGHDHFIPKHTYNQNHGHVYGGDHEKKGYDSHVGNYSYEEERHRDSWGIKNDYSAHGVGKQYNGEYPHREGMKHAGYGAHQGQYGPHREYSECPEERKKFSVWEFKSIVD
ncbi:hypothetical protein C2S52_020694 [Perilla frutescens var. hirtella]|uniref:Uncharacterized protein n=1 Tax=Perilla frutescens var. hirtella TaxID=608512 RepID=A0AAD4P386_PERFH|nr:hypothetical protein C2S52_020694 [Perilla frutescens var. hirtella]KAH6805175.1 hypothetical protein C2S51_030006 [Perilla frutescens var. frutescens]KAH6825278.1 hypothetical protein C2S53_007002 [Perilla frutescens var. hirtella]